MAIIIRKFAPYVVPKYTNVTMDMDAKRYLLSYQGRAEYKKSPVSIASSIGTLKSSNPCMVPNLSMKNAIIGLNSSYPASNNILVLYISNIFNNTNMANNT